MVLTFNTMIFIALGFAAFWMSVSASWKEAASTRTLTPQQDKTFNETYRLSRPASDYPADLAAHAAIAHPARIRKVWAAILIVLLIVAYIFIGT